MDHCENVKFAFSHGLGSDTTFFFNCAMQLNICFRLIWIYENEQTLNDWWYGHFYIKRSKQKLTIELVKDKIYAVKHTFLLFNRNIKNTILLRFFIGKKNKEKNSKN